MIKRHFKCRPDRIIIFRATKEENEKAGLKQPEIIHLPSSQSQLISWETNVVFSTVATSGEGRGDRGAERVGAGMGSGDRRGVTDNYRSGDLSNTSSWTSNVLY